MLKRELAKIRQHWLTIVVVVAVYAFLYAIKFPCLAKYCLGIPCPGCGMTHAVMALLRLDIVAAFGYHPMVWSLPVLALYILQNGRIFFDKRLDLGVLIGIMLGFLCNYVCMLLR